MWKNTRIIEQRTKRTSFLFAHDSAFPLTAQGKPPAAEMIRIPDLSLSPSLRFCLNWNHIILFYNLFLALTAYHAHLAKSVNTNLLHSF